MPGLKNVTFEYKNMCTIDHFLVLKMSKDLMVLRFTKFQIYLWVWVPFVVLGDPPTLHELIDH